MVGDKMDLEEAIMKTKVEYQTVKRQKDESDVLERYGYMFTPENLDLLTKEDFKSFLSIKNNKHWEGIHRQSNIITRDMDKLKKALKILLDENRPLKERLDFIFPKNKPNYIKGLGRAIVTPMLLVVYPTKYGVYNSRSAEGLRKTKLEPKFGRGISFSEKYIKINEVLKKLAIDNDMSLFELDNVWWKVTGEYKTTSAEEIEESEELSTGFGLEAHLRRFLVDNWENTPLGRNYDILNEDGDNIGEEFPTREAGIIDILAKNKKGNEWVVIELKRNKSADAVVGQTLRYMGWIEKHKAGKDEDVKGIIVVKEIDRKLEYALFAIKDRVNISCFVYDVKFSLEKVGI